MPSADWKYKPRELNNNCGIKRVQNCMSAWSNIPEQNDCLTVEDCTV